MEQPRASLRRHNRRQLPMKSNGGNQAKNANSCPHRFWLALWCLAGALLALAVGLVDCQEEQLTVESRQAKEQAASENELADTIKYLEKLEKLDKYWSEVARPRFGRSDYKQQARPELFAAAAAARPMRFAARSTNNAGSSPLVELINARLAQRYNSNESY